ncbi:MAG: hypothetical protein JWO71_3979 [Candidatus Acidoferrum typicum]|nr:hypothetical protein [Candidatus Acidoferrum typicum]
MKGRASLLKSLTRLDRYSKTCLARVDTYSKRTLRSGDAEELAHTSREIVRVQLNMMKLFRELPAVSNQIRGLVPGEARCLAMPAPADAGNQVGSDSTGQEACERFAFTAVITGTGAEVVRVLADTSAVWPQQEYGCFETWTQAQDFATVLNQTHGIDPIEAQHIVVSANLALRSSREAC